MQTAVMEVKRTFITINIGNVHKLLGGWGQCRRGGHWLLDWCILMDWMDTWEFPKSRFSARISFVFGSSLTLYVSAPHLYFSCFFFLSTVSDGIPLQTVPKELTQTERNSIVSHFKGLPSDKVGEIALFGFYLLGKPPLFITKAGWRCCSGRGQYSIFLLHSRPG